MKNKRKHIQQFLAAALLLVFSIALTPWSALHHHPEVTYHPVKEKVCTHKLHLDSHTDTCLVCAAHFEKNYISTTATFQVFLSVKSFIREAPVLSTCYIALFGTFLRGPPSAHC
ncbi:hypothetical protein [Pedobacter sp.]|uniref:hypothetical protein n=1 Tax=Pedobacter sp. TaxID=1411316 RepID=UPI003D7F5A90